MSISTDTDTLPNIYEEVYNDESTCDLSCKNLEIAPELDNKTIRILYLQSNKIKSLPEDFFPSLPNLMWLDLRDNELTEIPTTIQHHPCLTHLLLQNNCLTSLPNELGTVDLKVLQINGNPITYPPKEILKGGVKKISEFLHSKFVDAMFSRSQSDISEDAASGNFPSVFSQEVVSYNSVIDGDKLKKGKLSIQLSEKDLEDSGDECYGKVKGKCPKLAKSRTQIPPYYQSSKYLHPLHSDDKKLQNEKIKQSYLRDLAIKKHKEFVAMTDKILQGRKNMELLRNWRKGYRYRQQFADGSYKLSAGDMPYDTSPEYMTLLTREDIERDLPDKYKKRLVRRSRPSVARKGASDMHLALRIKQLFETLDAIDLDKGRLTPRSEQRALLTEIQKITEIKQKLSELSTNNGRSVSVD